MFDLWHVFRKHARYWGDVCQPSSLRSVTMDQTGSSSESSAYLRRLHQFYSCGRAPYLTAYSQKGQALNVRASA
jgi:hypothetical protein